MKKIAAVVLTVLVLLGLGAAHAVAARPTADTAVSLADGYGWGGIVTPTP
ncbi:hypothetical protein ACIRPK_16490 [Kitasatospora sp. NPDC101801]